ncbi:ComEC/Rec2 family competence protein [Sphingomonas mesophila]|uniref:ComEC/Rec2 family competence protein n=1 Tax=Sphingomonas mesophila TaxID=2303576 RepID=UPI000E56EE0F|nr:ComEC/Rec2 family competence protein [Sphingomonas mesophila]
MNEVSAPNIEVAPLEPAPRRISLAPLLTAAARFERFLEAERGQLPLWFVAAVGAGIAGWFALPGPGGWIGLLCLAAGLAATGLALPRSRGARALLWLGIGLALGCALVWTRSERVAAPRLERTMITELTGTVTKAETLAAKGDIRLTVRPDRDTLPPLIRLSLDAEDAPERLGPGATIAARARLTPPPPMALPGGHDFARDAWFRGTGAVGRALGPVRVVTPASGSGMAEVRRRLDAHIRSQLPGASGTIATALATGDQNAVSEADAEAMRRSGLTHLLSVSGLHIAAVVGAAMLLTLRLLALSQPLALRLNLVLVAAAVGALAGIGYTWLTGMQVPTVRSCIAALLVLGGIALGRDAISLRLIAVGALLVMLWRPEAVAGASFQFSFAAVTAIVAFHSLPVARRLLSARDDPWPLRLARTIISLLLTGLVVELALIPLALYHFHKAGLYGVAANMVAIPWTTFVIMPAEALALLLDSLGLGAPAWAVAGWAIDRLLGLAHFVAALDGAVATLPAMPQAAFALLVAGGLWLCLWHGRVRVLGLLPFGLGAIWAAAAPTPDLLVSGDGRHLALVEDGVPFLLREKSGDFTRSIFSEAAGFDGDALGLASGRRAQCSRDSCVGAIERDGRRWTFLVTRTAHRMRWDELTRVCASVDIVVSDRWLPRGCVPRWLKLDRQALARTGGVAIHLGEHPSIASVAEETAGHPWAPRPPPPRAQSAEVAHTASSLPPGSMK